MEQQPLFFESVFEALKYVCQALGKPKEIGPLIFPHKEDPVAAGRLLSDCLNPDRPEKLDIEQVILLLRLAKERGCHAGVEYINNACGYSKPIPVDPDDEKAELQRRLIRCINEQRQLVNRLGLDTRP